MINCLESITNQRKLMNIPIINYSGEQNNKVSLQEQENNKDKLILMDHLWAYAMRKSSYERILSYFLNLWKIYFKNIDLDRMEKY